MNIKQNEAVKSIRKAIEVNSEIHIEDDEDMIGGITDLLVNIKHLCDKQGFEFDELLATADISYQQESQ